ncbi:MAG TPA: hypothetical protein VMD74_02035 [Candidatus Methylomirabilis sp.]|nr:hypothetical protein [Candidatus Methylomirabilis sp.]
MKKNSLANRDGVILPLVLVFGTLAMIILGGIISWATMNVRAAQQAVKREVAIQIAESGVEYYRWHLAHAPTDYQDGTGAAGPYLHYFYDKSGDKIGQFTLTITPPPIGSSIVTVKSEGKSSNNFFGTRTITTRLAKPSLAKYAVAANSFMRFGQGTEIFGPIHCNSGIRFDGIAHNVISSAVATFDDPDHSGAAEFGVHTHVNPPPGTGVDDSFRPLEAPPNTPQARSDVFLAGRQFPVPAVDFTGLTADFSQMKTDAQAAGFYRAGSGAMGYHVLLKTNDTFSLYRVDSLKAPPNGCTNSNNQTGWGSWSINNETLLGTYSLPANGLIFLEDNIFVDGQINTARVSIVAAVFPDDPSTRKSITVNNNLLYTNYDGRDVIALIAQNNINVGLYSQDILRIDAALIAQKGRAGRYYYESGSKHCDPDDTKNTITLNGMIASDQRYGFAYTDGTGYQTRNIIYDTNLLYSPPPSFPQTSDQYITISWAETL